MHRSNRRKSRLNGTRRKRLLKTRGGAFSRSRGKMPSTPRETRNNNVFAQNARHAFKSKIHTLTDEVNENLAMDPSLRANVSDIIKGIPVGLKEALLFATVAGLVAATGRQMHNSYTNTALADASCIQKGFVSYNPATQLCMNAKVANPHAKSLFTDSRGPVDVQTGPPNAPYRLPDAVGENHNDTSEILAAEAELEKARKEFEHAHDHMWRLRDWDDNDIPAPTGNELKKAKEETAALETNFHKAAAKLKQLKEDQWK